MTDAEAEALVDEAVALTEAFRLKHGDDALRGLFGSVLGSYIATHGPRRAVELLIAAIERVAVNHSRQEETVQ